jgi:hypothetical protein
VGEKKESSIQKVAVTIDKEDVMEDHLIFFLDFLGFEAAVENWPVEELSQVGALLHQIAKKRSNGWYVERPTENGK